MSTECRHSCRKGSIDRYSPRLMRWSTRKRGPTRAQREDQHIDQSWRSHDLCTKRGPTWVHLLYCTVQREDKRINQSWRSRTDASINRGEAMIRAQREDQHGCVPSPVLLKERTNASIVRCACSPVEVHLGKLKRLEPQSDRK